MLLAVATILQWSGSWGFGWLDKNEKGNSIWLTCRLVGFLFTRPQTLHCLFRVYHLSNGAQRTHTPNFVLVCLLLATVFRHNIISTKTWASVSLVSVGALPLREVKPADKVSAVNAHFHSSLHMWHITQITWYSGTLYLLSCGDYRSLLLVKKVLSGTHTCLLSSCLWLMKSAKVTIWTPIPCHTRILRVILALRVSKLLATPCYHFSCLLSPFLCRRCYIGEMVRKVLSTIVLVPYTPLFPHPSCRQLVI